MNHPTQHFSREEPLPGYTTTELLGRGGFGEVWRAVAPGGVAKAIKLVFGDDPKRAELELRSLNRIKDVRHPLILSIDRIEVVKGTLVIVTELGDCNLKETCLRFRSQGHAGIPQPEVLSLLHDAAEALDYIYAEHSLQHLDVKPENFLVFGKHLKIADFGVVKHIYERSASMVHGLTPVYSAPELFEGKANRHTDQYSLAIVYQEMLTGQLPFDGLSTARLATQHLKEAPNLQSLPIRQQPIIARALSKDPHQRFHCCVELMEELENAASQSVHSVGELRAFVPLANEDKTRLLPSPAAAHPTISPQNSLTQANEDAAAKPRVHALLQSIEQGVQSLPPAIIVGIGGTAAHVIRQLWVRINERLGRLDETPSLQLLMIDSDGKQLNQINRNEEIWRDIETIATPLRRSDQYRSQHDYLRRWLNRRWLYNIPRDQSTDGIRPLGRLALVSNFKRVLSAIEKAILECSSPESAVQSADSLDLPFAPGKPRVLLLASISGGTGSGMLLDLAYAIRSKLRKAGFDSDRVDAVLMHSTPRNKGRDKAIANAYATLQELEHYSLRGNYYPGDPHVGIEAFHGNNRVFGELDFLPLGENLDEHQWLDAADDVAEYLFGSLLEPQSISPSKTKTEGAVGRTIAIRQLGAANRAFLKEFSSQICLEMLNCWRGRELQDRNTVSFTQPTTFLHHLSASNAAKHRRLSGLLDEKIESVGLTLDRLLQHAAEVLTQEVGKSPEKYVENMVQDALRLEANPDESPSHAAFPLIDHWLSADKGGAEVCDENGYQTLFGTLLVRSETIANKLASELRDWLQQLVNDPNSRVDGSQYAAEQADARLQDLLSAVASDIAHEREKTAGLKLSITSGSYDIVSKRSRWNPFRARATRTKRNWRRH